MLHSVSLLAKSNFRLDAKILSLASQCFMLYSLAQSCSIHSIVFELSLDRLLNASFFHPNTVVKVFDADRILSSIPNSPKWLKEYSRVK